MMMLRILLCLFLSLGSSAGFAQTIYLKPDQALKVIFHDSKEITSEKKSLTPIARQAIEKRLGVKLAKTDRKRYGE